VAGLDQLTGNGGADGARSGDEVLHGDLLVWDYCCFF
jgi:hypothetical protein